MSFLATKSNFYNSNQEFSKFSARILGIYKMNNEASQLSRLFEKDQILLWFLKSELECDCPRIKPYRKYLIMAKVNSLTKLPNIQNLSNDFKNSSDFDSAKSFYSNNKISNSFIVDKEATVIEWRSDLARRVKHVLNQKCN